MWPAKKAKRESWRPEAKCKSLLLAALSRTPRDIGTKAGLPGWRCSADRAGLLRNSLLTGNLTGNFTKSGRQDRPIMQETAVPQLFLSQFPKQESREKIHKNREFFRKIRELREGGKRPFLTHLFCGLRTRSVLTLDLRTRGEQDGE